MSRWGSHFLMCRFGGLLGSVSFSYFQMTSCSNLPIALTIPSLRAAEREHAFSWEPQLIRMTPLGALSSIFWRSEGSGFGGLICTPPTSMTFGGKGFGPLSEKCWLTSIREVFLTKSSVDGSPGPNLWRIKAFPAGTVNILDEINVWMCSKPPIPYRLLTYTASWGSAQ